MGHLLDGGGPAELAACRRAGTLSRLPLHELGSRADAEAFQGAAVRALGGEPCGYKIGATSLEVQRLLNVEGYEVVGYDPDGITVVLDLTLLREQFELARR